MVDCRFVGEFGALTDGGGVWRKNTDELPGEYWSLNGSSLDEPFEHRFADEFIVWFVSHWIVDDWLFETELLLIIDAVGDGVENWRVELSGLPKHVWLDF